MPRPPPAPKNLPRQHATLDRYPCRQVKPSFTAVVAAAPPPPPPPAPPPTPGARGAPHTAARATKPATLQARRSRSTFATTVASTPTGLLPGLEEARGSSPAVFFNHACEVLDISPARYKWIVETNTFSTTSFALRMIHRWTMRSLWLLLWSPMTTFRGSISGHAPALNHNRESGRLLQVLFPTLQTQAISAPLPDG